MARLKSVPGVSPPLCPARYPPQAVAACPSCAARRILLPWGPSHARPFTARPFGRRQSGRRKRASKPTSSPSRRGTGTCSVFGSGAAIADAGRCAQCRVSLPRSALPRLQHEPDRGARHRAATEGNTHPRTGALHALQGLLGSPGLLVHDGIGQAVVGHCKLHFHLGLTCNLQMRSLFIRPSP